MPKERRGARTIVNKDGPRTAIHTNEEKLFSVITVRCLVIALHPEDIRRGAGSYCHRLSVSGNQMRLSGGERSNKLEDKFGRYNIVDLTPKEKIVATARFSKT